MQIHRRHRTELQSTQPLFPPCHHALLLYSLVNVIAPFTDEHVVWLSTCTIPFLVCLSLACVAAIVLGRSHLASALGNAPLSYLSSAPLALRLHLLPLRACLVAPLLEGRLHKAHAMSAPRPMLW